MKIKINLTPTQEERSIPILVLTDGNNRALAKQKSYDDGGKKLIEIAEVLSTTKQISALIGCILSPENISKRSDNFKSKVIYAFEKLSERIQHEQQLIRDKIRLSIYGNMIEMKERSMVDRELAQSIEETCQLTTNITHPNLELILGVNYDKDIAKKLKTKAIIRTGLETDNNYRTSGINIHPGIQNFGITKLWPEVEASDILNITKKIQEGQTVTFRRGYTTPEIVSLIQEMLHNPEITPEYQLNIPFKGNIAKLAHTIDTKFQSSIPLSIVNEEGKIFYTTPHSPKTEPTITLVHYLHYERNNNSPHAFIVPGQRISGIRMPQNPEIEYANLHACPNTTRDIINTVKEAISFVKNTTQLKGAEREIPPEQQPEFSQYFEYLKILKDKPDFCTEETAKQILKEKHNYTTPEQLYNTTADLAATQMLNWSIRAGFNWTNTNKLRAFLNYCFTAFFLSYYPEHPQWEAKLSKDWQKRYDRTARFMTLTSIMDDLVFDDITTPEIKEINLKFIPGALIEAIKLTKASKVSQNHPNHHQINTLIQEFYNLSQDLSNDSSPQTHEKWQTGMIDLIDGMEKEWGTIHEILNPTSPSQNEEIAQKLLTLSNIPNIIREKLTSIIERKKQNPQEQINDELKLYLYLTEIEKSIGAGVTYKTLNCINENSENEAQYSEIEKLSSIINIYFRIANDLAEDSRNEQDRDNNISTKDIIKNKYRSSPEENKELLALKELASLLKEAKTELYDTINKFQQTFSESTNLAIAMQRARIGELFYKGTHYREATREQVRLFFSTLQNCGI